MGFSEQRLVNVVGGIDRTWSSKLYFFWVLNGLFYRQSDLSEGTGLHEVIYKLTRS